MPILKNIKRSLRDRHLKLDIVRHHRNRVITNLYTSKRIGVVYDASDEENYKKVSDFVRYLQSQGKVVKALGYLPYKIIPHYCNNMLSYDYYLKKDINWFGKPSNTAVKDFVSEEFDILIDLNINDIDSITYISALSMARFKVGLFSEHSKPHFDMMFTLEDRSLHEYVKQVVHYLGILNHSE